MIEVPAICDTDLPKARALADRFGVKDAFDDIEDLLRYEALDAVVICSPNHLHESHILAALSANLHVLVEKPLAMSAASAQRIVRAVEKRDRVVMVGMNHRYRPDVQIVRSFVQSGELGTHRERARELARLPAQPQPARLAAAARSGGRRRHAGPRALHPRSGPLAGRQARARAGERQPRRPGKDRAVEQSGSAFVVCENGMSLFVDVTWRHLGEGERFGVGLRGSKGTRGDQSAHRLEGAARRPDGCLAHRVGQPGERLHRLVPGRVGPLRGGHRRRGQGSPRSRSTSCCTRWWTRSTARRRTDETWCCEAGRRQRRRLLAGALLMAPAVAQARPLQTRRDRPARELTGLPHDHGPGRAGVGAVRSQRDLDPRSGIAARTPPTTTACSTSSRRTSCSASSAGRCGTGWRAFPPSAYVRTYVRDNRSVWVQELNLPPAARLQLREFLRWNEQPEHRFYHYDYYRDNCSTRVRDALDRVLGGAIKAQTARTPDGHDLPVPYPAPHGQRSTRLHGAAAGARPGVDRPISAWEEMFLPLALREHVRRVMLPGPNGTTVPLVAGRADALRVHRARAARRSAIVAAVVRRCGCGRRRARRTAGRGRRRHGAALGTGRTRLVFCPLGSARRTWRRRAGGALGASPITPWRTGTRTCSS